MARVTDRQLVAAERRVKLAQLRAAESILLERERFASLAGVTFDGARDTYTVLGYKKVLTYKDFLERFARDDIAQRIVKAFPAATWSDPPAVVEDKDPEKVTRFEESFRYLAARLKLWAVLERADRLQNLGRYSIVLLGLPGKLDEPAKPVSSADQVLFAKAYSEQAAQIATFVEDATSPRYGLPETYKVDLLGDLKSAQAGKSTRSARAMGSQVVHASRVLHIVEDRLEDDVFGCPRLLSVWNRMDDLAKVVGGGSEAFWITANRGMQLALQPGASFGSNPTETAAAVEALETKVTEFLHGARRFVQTSGIDMNPLGAEAADGGWLVDAIFAEIAGATGIPRRILTGSEEGSLASDQDRHNWNERVAERERSFAEPDCLRQAVDKLIELKALPKPAGQGDGFANGYHVEWPAMRATTETQQADIALKYAQASVALASAENIARLTGGDPPMTAAEWRDAFTQLRALPQGERQRTPRAREPISLPAKATDEEPTPRANAEEFDQVSKAIGRRAKAEEWNDAIEAWALAELAIEAQEVLVALDSVTEEEAPRANALRANDGPLTPEQRAQVESALAGLRQLQADRIEKTIEPVLDTVIVDAAHSAQVEIGLNTDFAETRKAVRNFVADYTFTFAKKVSEESERIVRSLLDEAIDLGQTLAETRAAVLDRFTTDVTRAQMIARTETIRASNAGAVETYRQAGITEKRWITAGDACEFCLKVAEEFNTIGIDEVFAKKGTVLTADSGRTMRLDYEDVAQPPLHPACRCACIAVVS